MKSLTQNTYWMSDNQKETTAKIFAGLGMPMPNEDEYSQGTDGLMLFLNNQGSIFRLQNKSWTERHEHPHILKPLGRRERSSIVFEIMPGIICPSSPEDVIKLRSTLAHSNLRFWDDTKLNCGYLPEVTGMIAAKKYPVVLDPGAVEKFNGLIASTDWIRKLLKRPPLAMGNAQEKLYAPLHESFNAAWPKTQEFPDSAKMADFWNKCSALTKEGKLVAGWLREDFFQTVEEDKRAGDTYKNIGPGCRAYASRWSGPQ